nr:Chain B, Inhibitor Peptide [synthetic construct]
WSYFYDGSYSYYDYE